MKDWDSVLYNSYSPQQFQKIKEIFSYKCTNSVI